MRSPLFLTFLAALLFAGCNHKSESSVEMIRSELFLNPPTEYRSAPFWALNDILDTAEIIKQIYGFKEAGYGGFFLHSRTGLLTEYMGKEWWKAMDAGVKGARLTGLKAWFYDEDKWPSGFAGGRVPLMSEKFHARCMIRIGKNELLSKDDQLLFEDEKFRYVCHKSEMGNAWFNGTTYVDLLNPEMVKAFIDCAYVPYLERYKNEMGKAAGGIFTDEPQVSPRLSGDLPGSVSYSSSVIDKFREMHGYDIIPDIPSLFDSTGNFRKIRYDYYQTISRCFEENFTKQIGEFNSKYNSIFTGHINGEENLSSVMANVGNAMITYRHMQMPGIDQLGLNYSTLNSPKSVSSVANQYGIARRLSESYGISGQNMNFEDRKWLLDWLTINGINFIVPHLSLYSMKGERKRDYPPNFSPAQPYWDYNHLFEEYTGRMCYINTIGQYGADILVIHPLESEYPGIKNDCYNQYDRCLNILQENHRDYDLGDEQIIADIAKVENGRFVIGRMSYKVVILPSMLVMRRTTLELLKEFKRSGGVIIAYGSYPELINGVEASSAIDSLRQMAAVIGENEFTATLDKVFPAVYKLTGVKNELIWSHSRKVNEGGIIQLSNTSRLSEVSCELSFNVPVKKLALWNPENGHSMKLVPDKDGSIKLQFAAAKSWVISFGDASDEADLSESYQVPSPRKEVTKIEGVWQGERLDPNALTLDFARYSTDKGKTYSTPEPLIGIHQRLLDKKYNGKLFLKFEPEITDVPARCSLVLEQPELYNISVNNNIISFESKDRYRDQAFRTQEITASLKEGRNEIILSLDYIAPEPASLDALKRYGTEIESIYLIGDFAVAVTPSTEPLMDTQKNYLKQFVAKPIHSISRFSITKEVSEFDNDLTLKGYPFYAGTFVLNNSFMLDKKNTLKKYYLSLPLFEAIIVKVEINGKEFAPLMYSPWETEISEALKEGENTIQITLINSLRNLLGPHHHAWGELTGVGPVSFTGNKGWPNIGGDNDWYDLRLKRKPELWRDDYYLIPFGLLQPPVISESD